MTSLMQDSPAQKKKKGSLLIGLMVGPKGDSENPDSSPPPSSSSPDPGLAQGHAQPPAPGPEGGSSSGYDHPIPPDAVGFHTAAENCGVCEYMMGDGTCSYLKIPVQHGDHCQLFEQKGGAQETPAQEAAEGEPAPSASGALAS